MTRWTVKGLLDWTQEYLAQKGSPSPRREGEELLAHVLGMKRLDLYLDLQRPLTKEELEKFKTLVKRRARGGAHPVYHRAPGFLETRVPRGPWEPHPPARQ